MAPRALVPREDAIALVEKYIEHFKAGVHPPYSSRIWKDMSDDTGGKWSYHNVYTNVTQNRRQIVTAAFENQRLEFPVNVNNLADDTVNSTGNDLPSYQDNDDSYEFEEKAKGLEYFKLIITQEQWQEMLGSPVLYGDGRTYSVLEKEKWTDILSIIIFRQTELPCAFNFDKCKIYTSPDSIHYCRITGHCSSKPCGNLLFIYLDKDPEKSEQIEMNMRARDTFWEDHEEVHRPLRGLKRQRAGGAAYYLGTGNWQRREAEAAALFGGRIGPNVPSMATVRRAKNEFVNRELDVKPEDGKDVVKTIEEIKYSGKFGGFIQEVRRDKFYVSYCTHGQMHAYNQYCRLLKDKAVTGTDGTGSVIKKIRRLDGTLTGHIFLYSVTINYNGKTISVYDMLTESQETDTIMWWLRQWVKIGATIPPQMYCDRSRALMNGISLALNDQTIKVYNETLFLLGTKNDEFKYRSPVHTFIRNDVAHIMIMVAKWEELKRIPLRTVRQFYLYYLALLIDAQTVDQFGELLLLGLTVGLHASNNTVIKALPGKTVLDCYKKLEGYIEARDFSFKLETLEEINPLNTDELREENQSEDEYDRNSRVQTWIHNIRKVAMSPETQRTLERKDQLNNCFHEDFIKRLLVLCYEFPLWSAAALPGEVEHSSTAFTEGLFNDVKHRMNKNDPGLARADKFLKRMYKSNSNNATLFTSGLKHCETDTQGQPPSPTTKSGNDHAEEIDVSDSDMSVKESDENHFREADNVRENQSPVAKRKKVEKVCTVNEANYVGDKNNVHTQPIKSTKGKGKYFKARPDIRHRHTLAPEICESQVLINGNIKPGTVVINRRAYHCINTCGFDSMVHILCTAAMDDPNYKKVLTDIPNQTLTFVSLFLANGARAEVFKGRTKLLKDLFVDDNAESEQHDAISSRAIDMFTSVDRIWATCFKSDPSLIYVDSCQNCGENEVPQVTLGINSIPIQEKGFGSLQEALDRLYQHPSRIMCNKKCSNQVIRKCSALGRQIYIELGIPKSMESAAWAQGQLRDFPLYIKIAGYQCRLAGIIENVGNHFVSYSWRVNKTWRRYDDRYEKTSAPTPNQKVTPHGVIYIRIDTDSIPPDCQNSATHETAHLDASSKKATAAQGSPPSSETVFPNSSTTATHLLHSPPSFSDTASQDFPPPQDTVSEDSPPSPIIEFPNSPSATEEDLFEYHTSLSSTKNSLGKSRSPSKVTVVTSSPLFNKGEPMDFEEVLEISVLEKDVNTEHQFNWSSQVSPRPAFEEFPEKSPDSSQKSNPQTFPATNYEPVPSNYLSKIDLKLKNNVDKQKNITWRRRKDSDTFARDNWRNKGSPGRCCFASNDSEFISISEEGTVVESSSYIENMTPTTIPILSAGDILPVININSGFFHAKNTSGFDCLIQILLCAALNEPTYLTSMQKSNNSVLQFINLLTNNNVDNSIYKTRGELLLSLYSTKVIKEVKDSVMCDTLNLSYLISDIWQVCFANEPSVLKVLDCTVCGEYQVPEYMVTVDKNKILQNGINSLQTAIQFYKELKKVKCRKNCQRFCKVTCRANFHIFINLDIKLRDRAKTRMKCRLKSVPEQLYLEMKYRLVGIVAFETNRLVSYCPRLNQWERYDSYTQSAQIANADELIEPHGAIYILQ